MSAGNKMKIKLYDMSPVYMVNSGSRCTNTRTSRIMIRNGAMRGSRRWKQPHTHTHINLHRQISFFSSVSATHVTSAGGKASSAEGLLNAMDVNIEGPPRFFCPLDAHHETTTSRTEIEKTKSTRPLIIYLESMAQAWQHTHNSNDSAWYLILFVFRYQPQIEHHSIRL